MTHGDSVTGGSAANESQLTVDKPATYCIRVAGLLDENYSTHLGGLKTDPSGTEMKTATTTLSGPVLDQAALFGVLKALYDMRFGMCQEM